MGHDPGVIRNAVLHMNNEQPLVADLFDMPEGNIALLRCTNLRMQNGKRPIFADDQNSTFLFPMVHIRFIEILPSATGAERLALGAGEHDEPIAMGSGTGDAPDDDLEIDQDFLRRIREA
jgi:hypothetical protein